MLSQRPSPRQGPELAGGGAGGTGRHQPHGEGQKQLSATLCLAALAVCQAVGPHCKWTSDLLFGDNSGTLIDANQLLIKTVTCSLSIYIHIYTHIAYLKLCMP